MIRTALRRLGRRLRRDERGNVAMMVAVAVVPLTMAALGGLDLTRSLAAKVALQDALDAAALAAGRSGATDQATLTQVGQRILTQNLSGTLDFTVTSSSFTLGQNGAIVASAQGSFQPSMAGLFGSGPATFGASTEVTRANSILEIALVLDNTGSMSQSLNGGGSKISYLRTAASNFVDTMAKAAAQSTTANSVQISLVPFANAIKVGTSYRDAAWIDQNGVSPINDQIFTTAQGVTKPANRFTLFANLGASWGGCVETRQAPYDVRDTAPDVNTPATLFTPFFAPDEADGGGGNDYANDPAPLKTSKGKVTSDWWYAQGDINKYQSSNLKRSLTTSMGPNDGCSMQAMHRLTTDFSSLKTSISQMSAGGETDIPLGLMWGWHTLSPNAPFADGVAYNAPKHRKIVVLMTDGQNTMSTDSNNKNNSHYSSAGYVWQGRITQADGTMLSDLASSDATRTAALDSRLQTLCDNMKQPNVNIEIYAVGVGVTTASATLLKSCASDAGHYFDVTSGAAIDTTFQSIANSIAALHLSK